MRSFNTCKPQPWLLHCLLLACVGSAQAAEGPLHVPSPDWRDQILYFALTDRFDDANPGNNRQGPFEYQPGSNAHYQGGDLAGVQRRLDYIQGLGATAVWLTPWVANQWWDGPARYSGYHGYWAEHFMEVDAHLGSLADLQDLSRSLHGRGMYLVQDIVLNHTGNFFWQEGGWKKGSNSKGQAGRSAPALPPEQAWRAQPGPDVNGPPAGRPRQKPFDLNDARDPAQRAAGIYHWTPDVVDYADPQQVLTGQMAGLDDLNTENPVVRRALRESYGHWIRNAGVDAFRVDTAFYVPPALFEDFLNSRDPAAPGMREVARQTGRQNFYSFGEGFGIDPPGRSTEARRIQSYMARGAGGPRMDGMLNFPLYGALNDVFARGQPAERLGEKLRGMRALHPRWHWMPSFVDNHDVDRFLAGGSPAGLRQALLAIMTLPGVPTIYYGTEQGFSEQRASFFAAGFGSGGRDRFDTQAPLYQQIARMTALRHSQPVLRRGWPTVLHANAQGPGALAWRMDADASASQGTVPAAARSALVVFNTADHPVLLDHLATGLPPGTHLQAAFGLDGLPADVRTGPRGEVTLNLPPHSGQVWLLTSAHDWPAHTSTAPPATAPYAAPTPQTAPRLQALPPGPVGAVLRLRGHSPAAAGPLKLVVNGNLGQAVTVQPGADGRWDAELSTGDLLDESLHHRVIAWRPSDGETSPALTFRVRHRWQTLADVEDPAGDDMGPAGHAPRTSAATPAAAATGPYHYPTDPSFAPRTMDLRRLRVHSAAGALRLTVDLAAMSTLWNPANGFDHLALTVFIELPGLAEPGQKEMPLQNGELPEGMVWHRRLRLHGWSNALFSAAGSGPQNEGRSLSPGAQLQVDATARRITLTLPASALGHADLRGARIWLNTWDWDGGYRALAPQAQSHVFGGGDAMPVTPQRQPLWIDASEVVRLGQ